MGYALYEEPDTGRWAGYAVPAECDWPDCAERIFRGLGFRCESHLGDEPYPNTEPAPWESLSAEGCGLFFCERHRERYQEHQLCAPKPDTDDWVARMLTEASWAPWRAANPEETARLHERMQHSEHPIALTWPHNGTVITGRWRDIAPEPAHLVENGWRLSEPGPVHALALEGTRRG